MQSLWQNLQMIRLLCKQQEQRPARPQDVGSAHGKARNKMDANWVFSVHQGMVWVGREGTSTSHPVQHSCNEQGQLQIHQVEILHVSRDGTSTTSGKSVPVSSPSQ